MRCHGVCGCMLLMHASEALDGQRNATNARTGSGIWRAADNCKGMGVGQQQSTLSTRRGRFKATRVHHVAALARWVDAKCNDGKGRTEGEEEALTRTLTTTGPPLAVAGRPAAGVSGRTLAPRDCRGPSSPLMWNFPMDLLAAAGKGAAGKGVSMKRA